jgi:hypothetical protein
MLIDFDKRGFRPGRSPFLLDLYSKLREVLILWQEQKLAAKLLLQPTKQSTVLIFMQESVLQVVSVAALAVSLQTVN